MQTMSATSVRLFNYTIPNKIIKSIFASIYYNIVKFFSKRGASGVRHGRIYVGLDEASHKKVPFCAKKSTPLKKFLKKAKKVWNINCFNDKI